jgi:photosystem II stability/assembly factor-like uncharacterized protein
MIKRFLQLVILLSMQFPLQAQWQLQNAGFVNDTLGFYDFSIPDKNTAWAVCYDGIGGLFSNRPILDFTLTTNGGSTWAAGKMGNDRSLSFSNISAIDEMEAWVCMNKKFTTGGGLFHTKDGGKVWTQSNAGLIFDSNSFPDFVYFKDKEKGIAVGDPNNGYFEIYRTDNAGKNWARVETSKIPAPLPAEFGWINGYASVGNTIWFGTSSGRMYKSTDFGKTWVVNTVDPAGNFVMEIAFNDDKKHGLAHVRSNTATMLFATADGGITWTKLAPHPKWKQSRICAVPGTDAYISTSVNFGAFGSSISYDNGVTWTELNSTIPMAAAKFFNKKTGWAGSFFITGRPGSTGIYKSTIDFKEKEEEDEDDDRTAAKRLTAGQPDEGAAKINDMMLAYPNPANAEIMITLNDDKLLSPATVQIVTADNRTVASRQFKMGKQFLMPVNGLPGGIYFITVAREGKLYSKAVKVIH